MPTESIIGSVTFTPSAPRVGQSVRVEVGLPAGQPSGGRAEVRVAINGVPGSLQYLHWHRPGKKNVFVTARLGDGPIERQRHEIEVSPAEPGAELPRLKVRLLPGSPTSLFFDLEPAKGRARSTGTVNPFRGVRRRKERARGHGLKLSVAGAPAPSPVYEWSFGDRVVQRTEVDYIVHDFGPHLNPNQERTIFQVGVKILRQGRPVGELHRTVSVLNVYYVGKQRGVLQPPVDYDPNAYFENGAFRGTLKVRNLEPVDLTLTSWRVEPLFTEGERRTALPAPRRTQMRLKAGGSTTIRVAVANSLVPQDARGFAVHYSGTSGRTPLRVSAYFDIPSRWRRRQFVVPDALQAFLSDLASKHLVRQRNRITLREVEQLVERGLAKVPAVEEARAGTLGRLARTVRRTQPTYPRSGHQEPPPAVEGSECDPSNLPSNIPENLVCQATTEFRWVLMPGRFMNARKGDIVLSPGDEGPVAGLLRNLTPPQTHSHSGIMTRNYDEIAHCTACIDRMMSYPVGSFMGEAKPTDGFRPDVVKYLWPGGLVQRVEDAVHGEWLPDPEKPDTAYLISGFYPDPQQNPDTWQIVPPLLVKPDPLLETLAVRQRLHQIADFAIQEAARVHYRLYCFTDPTIGLTQPAPAEAGWAAGKYPAVCSSFVWKCVREKGPTTIEGTLEAKDVQEGAELSPGTPEGLYLYRADERRAAGEWLYDYLYNYAYAIAGDLVTVLTDLPDDIANQILNTLASDWSDTAAKDSDQWRNTTDARAVSPDNILWWDSPAQGGLYGYCEPLVYRPPRWEQVPVCKWRKVVLTGTISGEVRYQGAPVRGAHVEVYQDKFTATDGAGRFTLTEVPEGAYALQAWVVLPDGMRPSLTELVTVVHDQITHVVINLQPPPDRYRAVTIDGQMFLIDDEWGAAANPHCTEPCYQVLRVGPDGTHDYCTFVAVCDDSVRAELEVHADLNLDTSVTITFTGRIFASEDPADGIDSYMTRQFVVPKDRTVGWTGMKLVNDDDDSVAIDFWATNALQST